MTTDEQEDHIGQILNTKTYFKKKKQSNIKIIKKFIYYSIIVISITSFLIKKYIDLVVR